MNFELTSEFFAMPMSFEAELVVLWQQLIAMEEANSADEGISKQIANLKIEVEKKTRDIFMSLRAIDKVEIARHPNRPHSIEYIQSLCSDFFELEGDRYYGTDRAVMCGIANFRRRKVMIIGQEKGNIETRKFHNYGSAMPEGYRKIIRTMRLAEELRMPLICLIDTPGAYHGLAAEERGQASALADSIATMAQVKVPVISCILGEGGSGGAIAIAAANRVLMLENAVYSVITPEGCASILWQNKNKRDEAAEAQKLTAQDLLKFEIVDQVLKEPFGGAHKDRKMMIQTVGDALESALNAYSEPTQYHRYMSERVERYRQNKDLAQVIAF